MPADKRSGKYWQYSSQLASSLGPVTRRDRLEIELKKPLADISTKPTNRVNAIFASEKLLRSAKKKDKENIMLPDTTLCNIMCGMIAFFMRENVDFDKGVAQCKSASLP